MQPQGKILTKLLYLSVEDIGIASAARSHVLGLADGLRQAGVDVTVIAPEKKRRGFSGRIMRIVETMNAARHALRGKDILYVRAHPLILPLTWIAKAQGCKVFHEVNGRDEEIFIKHNWAVPLKPVFLWMQRQQYRTASGIAAVTPGLAAWVASLRGVSAPVAVVSNGVDTRLFRRDLAPSPLAPDNPYVLFFGSFAPWHDVGNLLQALQDSAWPKNVSLVFAGDGQDGKLFTPAILNDSRIVKLPKLDHVDLAPLIHHAIATLVVLRNVKGKADRGLAPLKLFESLAAGTPVIASDMPFMAELVKSADAGIIVPEQDPAAVASAVAKLAADTDYARLLGTHGHQVVLKFHGWGVRGQELCEFFALCASIDKSHELNFTSHGI